MINKDDLKNIDSQPQLKSFSRTLITLILFVILWQILKNKTIPNWLWLIEVAVLLIAFFRHEWLKKVMHLLLYLSNTISSFTNPIILAFFYFLIFTPYAVFYRFFSSHHKKNNPKNQKTAWIQTKGQKPIDPHHQF